MGFLSSLSKGLRSTGGANELPPKITFNPAPAASIVNTYPNSYVWKVTAKFLNGRIWPGKVYSDGSVKRYGTVTLIR